MAQDTEMPEAKDKIEIVLFSNSTGQAFKSYFNTGGGTVSSIAAASGVLDWPLGTHSSVRQHFAAYPQPLAQGSPIFLGL